VVGVVVLLHAGLLLQVDLLLQMAPIWGMHLLEILLLVALVQVDFRLELVELLCIVCFGLIGISGLVVLRLADLVDLINLLNIKLRRLL
jgi:hypothetical protein